MPSIQETVPGALSSPQKWEIAAVVILLLSSITMLWTFMPKATSQQLELTKLNKDRDRPVDKTANSRTQAQILERDTSTDQQDTPVNQASTSTQAEPQRKETKQEKIQPKVESTPQVKPRKRRRFSYFSVELQGITQAKAYLDGRLLGKFPLKKKRVAPGKHILKVVEVTTDSSGRFRTISFTIGQTHTSSKPKRLTAKF